MKYTPMVGRNAYRYLLLKLKSKGVFYGENQKDI